MLSMALNPPGKRPTAFGRFAPPAPTEIEPVHYRQITDKYYVGGAELIVLKGRAQADTFEVTSHVFPSPGTPGEGREGAKWKMQPSSRCGRMCYASLTSALSQRLALGCLFHASYIASAQ